MFHLAFLIQIKLLLAIEITFNNRCWYVFYMFSYFKFTRTYNQIDCISLQAYAML